MRSGLEVAVLGSVEIKPAINGSASNIRQTTPLTGTCKIKITMRLYLHKQKLNRMTARHEGING